MKKKYHTGQEEIIKIHSAIGEAFNNQFSFSKDEEKIYIDEEQLKKILNSINKTMGPDQFKRYFRPGPFQGKPIIRTLPDLNKYCSFLFKITKQVQYKIDTEMFKEIEVPIIREEKFVLTKYEDIPTWYLYYYSKTKEMNSEKEVLESMDTSLYSNFHTGKIFIKEEDWEEEQGTARIELDTHAGIEFVTEWFRDELDTIYYRVERNVAPEEEKQKKNSKQKKHSKFPLTQLIFKIQSHMNFHIGVYCAATRHKREPYAGTIIAVKGTENQNDENLKAMIHYLLRHKRIQEKYSFTFPVDSANNNLTTDVSEVAKIWHYDVKFFAGTYVIFFSDPYEKKFIRGFMKICKNGSVFLFTYKNYRTEPYIGVVKKINEKGKKDNVIINLGFHGEENEYRVRIFLSKRYFDVFSKNADNKKFVGIYSALQYENGNPFSSLFAGSMLKDDLSIEQIKKIFDEGRFNGSANFEFSIKSRKDILGCIDNIKDPIIEKFFKSDDSNYTIHFALKL